MSFRPYVPPTIGKKPSRRQFRRARAARPLRTAFDRRANRRSEPFASCAPDPAFICRPFACSRASAFWGRERLFSRRRDHCRPSPRRPLGGWVLCRARMPFRRRRGVPRIDPPRPACQSHQSKRHCARRTPEKGRRRDAGRKQYRLLTQHWPPRTRRISREFQQSSHRQTRCSSQSSYGI